MLDLDLDTLKPGDFIYKNEETSSRVRTVRAIVFCEKASYPTVQAIVIGGTELEFLSRKQLHEGWKVDLHPKQRAERHRFCVQEHTPDPEPWRQEIDTDANPPT
jgi:hypothetical protein